MKDVLKFYLSLIIPVLIFWAAMFFFSFLNSEEKDLTFNIINSLYGIGAIMLLGTMIGGMYFFYYKILLPKRERKLFGKMKALYFPEFWNFKMDEELNFLSGEYRGFNIIISPETSLSGESINIQVLVLYNEELKNLYKNIENKYDITIYEDENLSFITIKSVINFGILPKKVNLLKELDELIQFFKNENIKPYIEGKNNYFVQK